MKSYDLLTPESLIFNFCKALLTFSLFSPKTGGILIDVQLISDHNEDETKTDYRENE